VTRDALAALIYEAEEEARALEEHGESWGWVPWDKQTSRRERRIYLAVADAVLTALRGDGENPC
jgi:hypothetical protein